MKTLFTSLLMVFGVALMFAQPANLKKIEQGLAEGKDAMTVTELFKLIEVDEDAFFNENYIDGGTIYYIRDFGDYQKLSFATTWFDFMVMVDNNSDKVLYSTVEISGMKSPDRSNVFQQYHAAFDAHIKNHEKLYNVDIDLQNEDMSPLNSFTFGTGCGWDAPLPEKGMKMFDLIKSGDQETLMTWVKSMNPTIQAYGVMGLHFMAKKGHKVKLNKKDRKILEMVKNKKDVIDYCSNVDLNASTPMNAVLSDFYLDSIWELYKDSPYLD